MRDMNTIAYCKKLHQDGYTNKQIKMITKLSDSSISRIISGKTYKQVATDSFVRDTIFEDRMYVLNVLLECHEISGGIGLDDNNKLYIQILKQMGVNFDKVKNLYYDISKKALRKSWDYPSSKIADFNPIKLGLAIDDILDLLKESEE
jgi:hypothetical protein